MKGGLALAAVSLVVVFAACFVHTRSDGLECHSSSECNAPRVCFDNYCVIPDAAPCPSQCTSCNVSGRVPTCNYSGGGGNNFTCPQGYQCNINCQGNNACGSITCGGDACIITCEGQSACGSITCDHACACDITCPRGDCGTETCPQDNNGNPCVQGSNCSSSMAGCNTCP